jgi:hypothetical protein
MVWCVGLVTLALAILQVHSQYEPNTWINRDGRFYVNVNQTLVDDFSFDQSRYAASWYTGQLSWNREINQGWSNIALGRNNEHYPKHSWILPVLATPLFVAFGLLGTLFFNVLGIGLAGAGLYRFARSFLRPESAAAATIVFLFATSIREYMYDYHIDVLMLAAFSLALACAVTGRAFVVGMLCATLVVIRPTTLMLALPMAALLSERDARRSFLHAIGGALLVFAVVGGVNAWLFGRPWWVGYNRVLIVEHGVPRVESATDVFTVAFDEGIKRLWSGTYGLRDRFTIMGVAGLGLPWLLVKRTRYALAAITTAAISLVVFARYEYEGDRFHWLAIALFVPALGAVPELASRFLKLSIFRSPARAAIASGVMAVLVVVAPAFADPHLETILPTTSFTRELFKNISTELYLPAALYLLNVFAFSIGVARIFTTRIPALGAAIGVGVLFIEPLRTMLAANDLRVLSFGAAGLCLFFAFSRQRIVAAPFLVAALLLLSVDIALLIAKVFVVAGLLVLAARFFAKSLTTQRRSWFAVASLTVLLFVVGTARLASARGEREHLSSHDVVRRARAFAGTVPCDFLAWEHMSWECSHIDHGVYDMVGLALPNGVTVQGSVVAMVVIPTASYGGVRTLVARMHGSSRFHLTWATPDGQRGGVRMTVFINNRQVDLIETSLDESPIQERIFATGQASNAHMEIKIEVRPSAGRSNALVAVDGYFE